MAKRPVNYYTIVTNDEFETIVCDDVRGIKAVADFIGYSVQYTTKCIFYNRWTKNQKYKAIFKYRYCAERKGPKSNRRDLSGLTPEEKKELYREYHREYYKQYRIDNKQKLKEYARKYYIKKVLSQVEGA